MPFGCTRCLSDALCLSGDRTSPQAAVGMVHAFLDTPFESGRHERRVAKITAIEAGRDPATA